MRSSRLVALGMLVTTVLSGGVGTASAASAMPQAIDPPERICGSGYYVEDKQVLSGAGVYLLFNGTYYCAITMKTTSVGIPTRTSAGLQVTDSDWAYDTGDYLFYAGPVRQLRNGQCVRYFGEHGGTSYTSPWGNCG